MPLQDFLAGSRAVRPHAGAGGRGDGARRASPARAPRPARARAGEPRRRHRASSSPSASCRSCSGPHTRDRTSPARCWPSGSAALVGAPSAARRRRSKARRAGGRRRRRASPRFAAVATLADLQPLGPLTTSSSHRPADLPPAEHRALRSKTGRSGASTSSRRCLAHGNSPDDGNIVLLSPMLPWHNDSSSGCRLPSSSRRGRSRSSPSPAAAASSAASVLAAAVVVSLPVVGRRDGPRALPDSLMSATFACGILFAAPRPLRASLGPRSRGLTLGITTRKKWYGVG